MKLKRKNIPVYNIKLPEYIASTRPDHKAIGKKIDNLIKNNYFGKKIAIRAIGSQEHPKKTINELIRIIKKLGTDRYDPKRVGDRYDNIKNKKIDIFAIDRLVGQNSRIVEYLIEPFYSWPQKFSRKPIKLDIIILYDLKKLKRAIHQYKGRKDIKRDGFLFRDQKNKSNALLGIIKIL